MKECPILFSGAMVRALLDGRKTQTRRVVKGFALELLQPENFTPEYVALPDNRLSPYGFSGDRLYVRETCLGWWMKDSTDENAPRVLSHVAAYAADGYELEPGEKWIPSIHMPRAASRILLDVTGVRIERLQSISAADAVAEGIELSCASFMPQGFRLYDEPEKTFCTSPVESYRSLWDSLNATRGYGWDANPWVWVVEFRRLL